MKKILFLFFTLLLLAACGTGTDDDAETSTEESTKVTSESEEPHGDYNLDDLPDNAIVPNEIIADDDNFKVVVVYLQYTTEAIGTAKGESQVSVYLENYTDLDVLFKIESLIVDGVELDDYEFGSFMEPGESETSFLRAFNYDDGPELDEAISFTLIAYDDDTNDVIEEYDINYEF